MIIHISNHELIDIGMGITARMKEDLKKCNEMGNDNAESCKNCTWKNIIMKFKFREGMWLHGIKVQMCHTEEIVKAVLGEDTKERQN